MYFKFNNDLKFNSTCSMLGLGLSGLNNISLFKSVNPLILCNSYQLGLPTHFFLIITNKSNEYNF